MDVDNVGATTGAPGNKNEDTTFAFYGAGGQMCNEKGEITVNDKVNDGKRVGSYDEITAGQREPDIVVRIPVIDDNERDVGNG